LFQYRNYKTYPRIFGYDLVREQVKVETGTLEDVLAELEDLQG
jgi:hypothetical protein